VISDILSCINFTYLSGKYQWESEDPDDYFEKLHKLPYSHSVVAAFQNFSSFDGVEDIGTEELKEKDLTITKAQGEATKGQCDRNNKLKQLFRESKSSNDDAGERERTSNKVVKQLLKLLLNIDKKIFVNDFVKSYKDLEKLMPEELKGYKDNYIQLLEDNKARLNQMIEDIRYKESHGKVDELLQGFSYSNSTDMKTPEALLDKMFGKFSDYNGTICDPCVGVGTMLRYAVEKYGFKKENCYGIDINEDNVKICRKLGFVNIIPGDAQDPKTWEKLNMNFDKIIMNPPYDKNLHLKILREAMKHSDDIVNLSPIRWLQDPLAEYKKNSDFKKFSDIRKRIESLEVVSAAEAQKLFGSGQYENLGIYHLTSKGGVDLLPKPFISQALFDKVNLPTYQGKYKSFYSERVSENYKNFNKPFVKVSVLHGNVGAKDWFDIITPQKKLAMSKEQSKGGTGTFTFNFDTQEEAENFFAYCQTKFVKACNGNVKTNIRWPGYAVPFMPTYEHPWTDEELYKFFGLTPDEVNIIEKEIK
jgi:predicted RNA methylase